MLTRFSWFSQTLEENGDGRSHGRFHPRPSEFIIHSHATILRHMAFEKPSHTNGKTHVGFGVLPSVIKKSYLLEYNAVQMKIQVLAIGFMLVS
jgi:hypothetical protein